MKKIIIIGATSGIGRGLAEVYSQEDYLIGITGRRENLLEEVCARDKDKLFYQCATSPIHKLPFHPSKLSLEKWVEWIY